MNATVVRSHTLGTWLGCAPCIQPGPGEFNNDAFAPMTTPSRGPRPDCG
ncbi:hypothetical protein SMICM304S_02485 [Streptomyces microflavus]